MFKTLLRTLSALSITTISLTASMSFAVHPAHDLNLDCTDPVYKYTEDCRSELGIKPVTTDVWKNSFAPASLPVVPDTNNITDQFVLPEDSVDHYKHKERVNLQLDTDGNGRGDTVVGTSVFYVVKTGNEVNHYAGIRIDADLGAPLVEAFPEAVWKTRFKAVGTRTVGGTVGVDFYVNEIFDLTVKFIGTSDGTQTRTMGEISGYIQDAGYYGYKIDAQFNNAGVITGTDGITYGRFENAGAEPTDTIVGNLTGIIGERGALGAFHSDGNSNSRILGFAGGFRANGYSEDQLVALRKCVLDPFHAQCSEDKFDDLKDARIELCTQGNNASEAARLAKPHECHNAVVAEGCILNPFQATCTGEESDFNKHSAAARANRIAVCDNSVNAKDAFCKVGTIVADACADDPFHAICGSGYDGARKVIVKACLTAGNCAGKILARPNAATWANSFKTEDNPKGLGILPDADTYDYDKPFLKKIESASHPDSGIEIDTDYYDGNTYTYKSSLNLSTAEFNDTPLGGDAKDGVASFRGHATGQSTNHWYAGIFSTTDLGAPLTAPSANESKTASWVGSFYRVRGWGHQWSKDFVLEVNFANKSIEAFVDSAYYDRLIKGDYDDNGVISGTVIGDYFTDNSRYKLIYGEGGYIQPLTGLIGKEGAVGAFSYGGFVARPADLVVDETTGKNAETFLNKTCTDDPFHEFCYLSDAREARIRHCSTNDNAINTDTNIVNWDCMTDVESDSCIRHPFDEKCKPTATSHYETARENRSAFCKKAANVAHLFCIGAEQNALCLYDPFHTICSNAIYNNARKVVCKADSSHTSCTNAHDTSSDVTAITWLAGLYKDDGVVPQTKPDTIRGRHQFLQGTTDGLDNGDVEIATLYGGPFSGSLNLNTATFDGLELGLGKDRQGREDAADDGVAFFQSSNYGSYAGIFSGTDLGEPLVKPTEGADMTAKWYGQFKVGDVLKTDFTLDIDFSAQSTDGSVGTVEAFVDSFSADYYLLSGKFDDNGVISGTVAYGYFPNYNQTISNIEFNASLTGLIGAEGAVGVFTGGIITGGFVASSKSAADAFDPNVKFSDWLRSFGNTPVLSAYIDWTPQLTRFVQGTETGLNIRFDLRNTVPQTLTLADVRTDGEAADGVAYLSGTQRGDYNQETRSNIITHNYVGILSGTNLGATLPTVPAGAGGKAITAIWYGKLGLIAGGSEIPKRDIDLMVDFTNKRISHNSDVGGEHLVNFSATWKSGVGYDGMLDGVFTGDITYDATPTLHNGIYVANDNSKSDGTVTGLIGQQGVVGAFISDEGSVTSYAGGFVATPGVEYLDWVNSFSNPSDLLTTLPWFEREHQTRFVQGRETDVNPGSVINSVFRTLTLANGDLGGEAADGVVYATKKWPFSEKGSQIVYHRHFAGLLSGTNLGLPLSTVPAGANGAITAIWDGKLGLIADGDSDIPKRDIDLTVDFTNNKISHKSALNGAHFVDLNAKWINDDSPVGVLKGTITYNPGAALDNLDADSTRNSAGIVTGLIGQQGAVGAFRSNHVDNPTATHTSFAGGFVAVPVVNYLTWVHSFGNPSSLPARVPAYEEEQQTQFVQGTGTGLDTTLPGNIAYKSLKLADGDLGGEAADGVAYVFVDWTVRKPGATVNVTIPRYHAGILSGTHLGAPLDASVAATWSGKLGMAVNSEYVPPRDITLNIDFASKTISHRSAVNGKHFVDLSAKWINDDSVAGVLKGTITYNPGAALNDATNIPGTVSGLIGQEGAVGAFISNGTVTTPYAGGFVAAPTQ